jgi:hypothetical protein
MGGEINLLLVFDVISGPRCLSGTDKGIWPVSSIRKKS